MGNMKSKKMKQVQLKAMMMDYDLTLKIDQVKEFAQKFGEVKVTLASEAENELEAKNLIDNFLVQIGDDLKLRSEVMDQIVEVDDELSPDFGATKEVYQCYFILESRDYSSIDLNSKSSKASENSALDEEDEENLEDLASEFDLDKFE